MPADPLVVIAKLAQIFDDLGIPYVNRNIPLLAEIAEEGWLRQ